MQPAFRYSSPDGLVHASSWDGHLIMLSLVDDLDPATGQAHSTGLNLTLEQWRDLNECIEALLAPSPGSLTPASASSPHNGTPATALSITDALSAAQAQQLDALTTLIRGIVREEISRLARSDPPPPSAAAR